MHYRPRTVELIDQEIGIPEIETPAGYVWDIFMEARGPLSKEEVLSAFNATREKSNKKEEAKLGEAIKRLAEEGFLHETAGKIYPMANKV